MGEVRGREEIAPAAPTPPVDGERSLAAVERAMPTITPFLWLDAQAEEAMNFHASVFRRSKVISVNRTQGKVFVVGCETQQEIDDLWTKFTADGGTMAPATSSSRPSSCFPSSCRQHSSSFPDHSLSASS
jgi:hypothetical protein